MVTPVEILPGSINSDVVEEKIGSHDFQEVINLFLDQHGKWKTRPGFKTALSRTTQFKNAIEVNDELSGDRFMLYVIGTELKRIDYDIGNSPLFGYENESASTLTLPSGVTIGASAEIRFFYHRGTVRITGGSEPLWYGYIDRTIFPGSYTQEYVNDFETASDETDFTTSNTTLVRQTTGSIWQGSYKMEVTQTDVGGYCYRAFTVTNSKKFKISAFGYKATSQTTDNFEILIGSSIGGSEYGSINHSANDSWIEFEDEFTATGTTVYLSFRPSDLGNSDVASFDYIQLFQSHEIIIDGWFLHKTAVDADEINIELVDNQNVIGYSDLPAPHAQTDIRLVFGKKSITYDEFQYSKLEVIDDITDFRETQEDYQTGVDSEIKDFHGKYFSPEIFITGASLETAFSIERLSGLALSLFSVSEDSFLGENSIVYYIENQDLTEEKKEIRYIKDNFYYIAANANRLYIADTGGVDDEATGRLYDNLLKTGRKIRIIQYDEDKDFTTYITSTGRATTTDEGDFYIEFAQDIGINLDTGTSPNIIPSCTVIIYDQYDYDSSNGYSYQNPVELDVDLISRYDAFTGISQNAEANSFDYSHIQIMNDRSFIIRNATDAETRKILMYSPEGQYDVHPNTNAIPLEIGDTDTFKGIILRDRKLMAFKGNTLTQYSWAGNQYYEDVAFSGEGLFATNGYLVIDGILYYFGENDFMRYRGVGIPERLLKNENLQNKYAENVTTSSLIGYDKDTDEIVLFLSPTSILVYQINKNHWYSREMDNSAIYNVFSGIDGKMYVIIKQSTNYKFVSWNHTQTTFDEAIRFYFKTKVYTDTLRDYFKKLNDIHIIMKGNQDISLTWTDSDDSSLTGSAMLTPNASDFIHKEPTNAPLFFFKQGVEIEIQSDTTYPNLVAEIKSLILELEEWNGPS